jgi:phosphoribosylglycinamide formyltransferase-1
VTSTRKPARLVVLVSGSGTLLQALLDAPSAELGAEVLAVGSDRAGVVGLRRAEAADVPTFIIPPDDYPDRHSWDVALAENVAAYSPDLVVSAGFMRILGPSFLARFPQRVVNTHPALLPSFPGAHAVRDALAYGVTLTGCTVHLVDEGVDTGPVLAQEAVPVEPGDDEDSLHERVKVVERRLLVEVVARLARSEWSVEGRKVRFQ